jgi:cytochrome b subunit of formate dehydrogenase
MRTTLSRKTRVNWLIDAGLFLAALAAIISGIYFLYFPNGYQGGRNPWYDVRIVFDRATWSDIHTWGGVLMIVAAVIHLAIHTQWIKSMGKRLFSTLRGRATPMSRGAKVNLGVNAAIALSFFLTAISGIYFLFAPRGHDRPTVLFSPTAWDLIHTWAGVVMIAAALLHFVIHWRWITKVTTKFFASLIPQSESGRSTITAQ